MPSRRAAALIMPLALGCLQAKAQMVPVPSASAEGIEMTAPGNPAHVAISPGSYVFSSTAGAAGGVQLPPRPKNRPAPHVGPFSTVALGVTGSTLGSGVEAATPLGRDLNLRVGGTYMNLQVPFTIDGVNYSMAVKLTSGQGLLDWYPGRRGFHVSAGALYLRDAMAASASVDPGQQFRLGGTTYLNSVDDPVAGAASLQFQRKLAPVVLLGFGNLIPGSGRHISVPFEIGGAYLGPPQVGLQLAGTACTSQGCFNAATDPATQANLAQEETKLNRNLRLLQVYPVVSLGFGLRF